MSSIARTAYRNHARHRCRPKGGATFAEHDYAYSTNRQSGNAIRTCKRCGSWGIVRRESSF